MGAADTLPVNIYQDQDFYVPAFIVKVQNEELKRVVMNDILSVTYTDSLDKVDSFDMTVNNWDAAALTLDQTAFKYSDKDTFNPWKDVEVQMGYYRNGKSELRQCLIGEITTLTPNFPAGELQRCRCADSTCLTASARSRKPPFFNKKDSDIAKELVDNIATAVRKIFATQTQTRRGRLPAQH